MNVFVQSVIIIIIIIQHLYSAMKSGDTDADIDVASNGRRRIVILTCLWAASNKKLLIYLPVIG